MSNQDVLVGTFRSRVEAELACSRLSAQGVEARIESDDVGGAYPVLERAGVHVFVMREDSEQASRILANPAPEVRSAPGNLTEAENEVRGALETNSFGSRLVRSVLLVIFGILVGLLLARSQFLDSPESEFTDAGTVELDLNLDGRIDAWHDYEGSLYVRSRYDRNFDGELDAWNFLDDGVVVRSELDGNFDGDVDGWIDYEFESVSLYVSDLDGNGVPDRTVEYKFGIPILSRLHPNGGRLEQEGHFLDGELRRLYSVSADGTRALVLSYDELGRLVPRTH